MLKYKIECGYCEGSGIDPNSPSFYSNCCPVCEGLGEILEEIEDDE